MTAALILIALASGWTLRIGFVRMVGNIVENAGKGAL